MHYTFDKKRILIILLSCLSWAFIAHIMMLTNKYSVSDDSFLFSVGATYTSGRWMLGFLGYLDSGFFMGGHYSLPATNGLLAILFGCACLILITDLLEISQPVLLISLSGLFITTPVITAMLGFMFTAPYYMGAMFGATLSMYLIIRFRKWYVFVISGIILICSVGIYQACIPMTLSVGLIYLIHTVLHKKSSAKQTLVSGLSVLLLSVASLLCYLSINQLVLKALGLTMNSYKGMDDMGNLSLNKLLPRIPSAYRAFFHPTPGLESYLYPMGAIRFYKLLLVLTGILLIVIGADLIKEKLYAAFLQFLFLSALVPLATTFIYVMAGADSVNTLTLYSQTLWFAYVAVLVKYMVKQDVLRLSFRNALKYATVFVLFILVIIYCRYDNVCYLKAELAKNEAITYLGNMVHEIQDTEGYSPELPVALIRSNTLQDPSLTDLDRYAFSEICTPPYFFTAEDYVNAYNVEYYLRNWCGFAPTYLSEDSEEVQTLSQIKNMPHYPEKGSIQVLNDIVIVNY